MAAPQLSDEQREIIRRFMASDAAKAMWTQLEAGVMADWVLCEEPVGREACWRELQAILQLKSQLQDAEPMKRLNERNQERRATYTA